jgi:hypothetical protein
MVTEVIAEAADHDSQLYLSFMDSGKAFDMVDHTLMLTSLCDMGLDPHLGKLYLDTYGMVTSRVCMRGELSRCIIEARGIRQGGETSTEGERKSISDKSKIKSSSTSIGIPTVADDNCMISSTHMGAQTPLLMAEENASRIRYLFSTSKSKVMRFNQTRGP